ncbi:MAG: hypothetical protein K8F91_11405, partial [Candidatus Obscuribacterales bacterium]|nr:hypothetical protein [Candidatus Obscuribacterales bacterium]
MIRLRKSVQLLEWGQGTNTTNQRWTVMGTGRIVNKPKTVRGITTLVIELNEKAVKQNSHDDSVKVVQQGEGMTPDSIAWGEVAFGRLKSLSVDGSKTVAEVELKVAIKIDRRQSAASDKISEKIS